MVTSGAHSIATPPHAAHELRSRVAHVQTPAHSVVGRNSDLHVTSRRGSTCCMHRSLAASSLVLYVHVPNSLVSVQEVWSQLPPITMPSEQPLGPKQASSTRHVWHTDIRFAMRV